MEDDQYEDDTAAINEAVNRAIHKFVVGMCVVGVLSLVFSAAGWL